ncbi:MAG: hemolysin family protein [Nitrospinota bacterium]
MELGTTLMLIAVCVAMEGFFSGAELAFISLSRHKLNHLVKQGNRAAKMLELQLKSPARLYGTTSMGTNIFVVAGTVLMTAYFAGFYPEDPDFFAVLVMTPVTLLLGEIFPKAFYHHWADRIAYIAIYPLTAAQKIFSPVLWITSGIARLALGAFGIEERYDVKTVSHDEIRRFFVLGEKKFDLHPEEKKMIRRIFDFKKTTVEQCMVPLIHIGAAENKETIESVRHKFHKSGFSRMPVYKDKIYNITGIINSFDVLRYGTDARNAGDLERPAFYVYQSKKINDLLAEMQQAGVQMAVVVNEYSAAVGIVTREDLVEEIFGEIEDEYDRENGGKRIIKIGPNRWELDAVVEIDMLNERYGWEIPLGDYETVAGLILHSLETIPVKGETIKIGNLSFTIKEAGEMGITLVEVTGITKELGGDEQ